jgi:hypothetical protein
LAAVVELVALEAPFKDVWLDSSSSTISPSSVSKSSFCKGEGDITKRLMSTTVPGEAAASSSTKKKDERVIDVAAGVVFTVVRQRKELGSEEWKQGDL